jgi:hypothetical protein
VSESEQSKQFGLISAKGNANSSEYATPPSLWRPLATAVGGFDLDAAAGCEDVEIADSRLTKEDDSLSCSWHGDVWLNPPWGDKQSKGQQTKAKWLAKARREANRDCVRTITVLITCDPTTDWFQKHVVEAPVICLMNHRVQFIGQSSELPIPLCLVVYGEPTEELILALQQKGSVFKGREYHREKVQTTFR